MTSDKEMDELRIQAKNLFREVRIEFEQMKLEGREEEYAQTPETQRTIQRISGRTPQAQITTGGGFSGGG